MEREKAHEASSGMLAWAVTLGRRVDLAGLEKVDQRVHAVALACARGRALWGVRCAWLR